VCDTLKIALFITATPFIRGGSELLVEDLKKQLEKRGNTTKLFRLPFTEEYETGIFLNALSAQLFDFDDYDVLISFKWPAYLAVHRRKNLWLFHQFRQAYDLFGKQYGLHDNDVGNAVREMVIRTDKKALTQADRLFAVSHSAKRVEYYCGIVPETLHCPLMNSEKYYKKSIGDYIYYPSRITDMKRQMLAVEAMRYVRSGVKLILDGKCDDESLLKYIYAVINKYKLNDRVTINADFVSEEEKISRYANCLAGIYLPIDEDSPGFVTFEVFYSSKVLITVSDSGGVADFVKDQENAIVVAPNPQAIAEKIDYLYEHRDIAEQMGQNANKHIAEQNVNWDDTIRRLLA
jgi:glycosyltransferase involved in cell wall biosynthesis